VQHLCHRYGSFQRTNSAIFPNGANRIINPKNIVHKHMNVTGQGSAQMAKQKNVQGTQLAIADFNLIS